MNSWSDTRDKAIALVLTAICLAWFSYFAWISLFWLEQNAAPVTWLFTFLESLNDLLTERFFPLNFLLMPVIIILGIIWGALPFLIVVGAAKIIEKLKVLA